MKIKVKLFALGRELVGKEELELQCDDQCSVGFVIEKLKSDYSNFSKLNSFVVAVNMEYAEMNLILKDGDEVAIIPPVSGG